MPTLHFLQESSCQLPLRIGTIVISLMYFIFFTGVSVMNGMVPGLYGMGFFGETWRYIMLGVNIIIVLLSVLQIISVLVEVEVFIYVWMVGGFFHLLLNIVSGTLAIIAMFQRRTLEVCIIYCIFMFGYVCLSVYFLFVVASYYEYFDEENDMARGEARLSAQHSDHSDHSRTVIEKQ